MVKNFLQKVRTLASQDYRVRRSFIEGGFFLFPDRPGLILDERKTFKCLVGNSYGPGPRQIFA